MITQLVTVLLLTFCSQLLPTKAAITTTATQTVLDTEIMAKAIEIRDTEWAKTAYEDFIEAYTTGKKFHDHWIKTGLVETLLKYKIPIHPATVKCVIKRLCILRQNQHEQYHICDTEDALKMMLASHAFPINPPNREDSALDYLTDNADHGYWRWKGPILVDLLNAGAQPWLGNISALLRTYQSTNNEITKEVAKESMLLLLEAGVDNPKGPSGIKLPSIIATTGEAQRSARLTKFITQFHELRSLLTAYWKGATTNLVPIINDYASIPFGIHPEPQEKPAKNSCAIS